MTPRAAVRVAYVVSRFPQVSETFIVREMNAVAEDSGLSLRLYSLFRPSVPIVHPSAEQWVRTHRRASVRDAARGMMWWIAHRPVRLVLSLAILARAYRREQSQFGIRALTTFCLALGHAREMDRAGVEHIHAHFASYPATAAWVCWRMTGIPFSFTAHAHDIFVNAAFLQQKMDDARFVVAISDFNRRFLMRLRRSGTPIEVIHCGITSSDYGAAARSTGEGKRPILVCVASLQEYKGHSVLLRALAEGPPGEIDAASLCLVGAGVLEAELRRTVADLNLGDRVEFLGALPEDEVAQLLRRARVFVLASVVARDGQMDGIPVALMEAMACGVPVVSTSLSGIPELVRDRETGLLAAPGDSRSLRAAISETLEDSAATDKRVIAARTLIETDYEGEKCAAQLTRLIVTSVRARTRAA